VYGLDANIAPPPLSAIISILLVVGCDGVGYSFTRYFLKIDTLKLKWMRWQFPIIGAMLLSIVVFPMALFGVADRVNLQVLAVSLIVIALAHIILVYKSSYSELKAKANNISFSFFSWDASWIIMLLLIIGYLLFALSPITNADSLDYHVGVAIKILNTGSIFNTPEWFHSRLSGNGEVLNALGLSVGAEQFGSLLQFMGLVAIVGLILHSEGDNDKLNLLLAVLVLATPVFIFLVGSAKFQLLPIAMSTLALSLIVYPSQRNLLKNEQIKVFFLICMLVMVASQAKLNYLLSGGVIGVVGLFVMFRKRLIWKSVAVGLLAAFMVFFPVIFVKSSVYGSGYIEALLTPLPGDFPGIEMLEHVIRSGKDSEIAFPFSLVIPSGIGVITTIIGLGVFSVLFVRPLGDKWLITVIVVAIVVFSITILLGPKSSRSYLEPYLWCLIVITLQSQNEIRIKMRQYVKPMVLTQGVVVASLCWYGGLFGIPGAVSASWRDNVMSRTANGYTLMKWVDANLPSGAVLLNSHRSMAIVPRKAVSLDWLRYVRPGDDPSLYLDRIKKEKVTHLLLIGDTVEQLKNSNPFAKCLGEQVVGPGYGNVATRNPFNTGAQYKAWIINFNSEMLPNCFSLNNA